jgi:serine/threonine protein kinase
VAGATVDHSETPNYSVFLPRPGCYRDPDRGRRFEREARTVAALSHPNICAVFDVGREETPRGPVDYLVVEYLEGLDLSVRLKQGPLPTDQRLKAGAETTGLASPSPPTARPSSTAGEPVGPPI